MALTNYPNGITSFGIPQVGNGVPTQAGTYWFVNGANGADGNSGQAFSKAFATVQRALNLAAAGDVILVAPGDYDEQLSITRPSTNSGKMNLAIVGCGPRGSVRIKPSAADPVALTNDADNVLLSNLVCWVTGTGTAAINTGSRFQAYGCKFENTDATGTSIQMTLGTQAQQDAGTKGGGADCYLVDSEFAWSATGLLLTGAAGGLAVTQMRVDRCRFHNLGTAHVAESGGLASVRFRNIELVDCWFDRMEDGTEPTDYILLNADNANSGLVTRCSFPTALAGGKNLVSTAVLWVSNYHTGGVSNGQPS